MRCTRALSLCPDLLSCTVHSFLFRVLISREAAGRCPSTHGDRVQSPPREAILSSQPSALSPPARRAPCCRACAGLTPRGPPSDQARHTLPLQLPGWAGSALQPEGQAEGRVPQPRVPWGPDHGSG